MIGIDGLPSVQKAGNALHPKFGAKLSVRTPPTLDAIKASEWMVNELTRDPPYGAKIKGRKAIGAGWHANPMTEQFKGMVLAHRRSSTLKIRTPNLNICLGLRS